MKLFAILALSAIALFSTQKAQALTVEELHAAPGLTPQNFGGYFSNFKFVFGADVQNPANFLASQAGDCDDFATLAASELASRGYTPRLISIRMKREIHVVCYIAEANGYLDYNMRAKSSALVSCGSELSEIGASVSKSFKKSPWTSVSEFTYHDGVKRLVKTSLPKETTMASNH